MRNLDFLTLKQLAYLVALVEEKHVTRAADRLGIGQPAMSTALAKLRETFGDPILIRTTGGMEPTERAIDLAKRSKEALTILAIDQQESVAFRPELAEEHINIMASSGVADAVTPVLMEVIRKEAPGLRLTIAPGDIRRAGEYLRNGEMDLILGFIPSPAPDLHRASLYSQKLVGIARRFHPATTDGLTLQGFVEAGHVVWGAPPVQFPAFEGAVNQALATLGYTRDVVLKVASTSSTVAVVAATDLMAVVPEPLAKLSGERNRIQIFELPFEIGPTDIDMFWHARRHLAPTHQWIRAVMRRIAPSLAATRGPAASGAL